MIKKHMITSNDRWFLDKHMKDPVTQEPFKAGDVIVICQKCRTAHYESTWRMNSNRCCSMGCNHDVQLSFHKFSPVIFQHKVARNSSFSIVAEKLPFAERLKMFNGYPVANIVSILMPIFAVVFLVYSVYCENIPTYSIFNPEVIIQEAFADFIENSSVKLESSVDKIQEVNTSIRSTYDKFNAASLPQGNIKVKITDFGNQFNYNFKHIVEKLSGMYDATVQVIHNYF